MVKKPHIFKFGGFWHVGYWEKNRDPNYPEIGWVYCLALSGSGNWEDAWPTKEFEKGNIYVSFLHEKG